METEWNHSGGKEICREIQMNYLIMKDVFYSLILCICFVLLSCNSESEQGSILPEYRISDSCLDSVTSVVLKDSKVAESNKTVVLELNVLENDTIDFVYSFHDDVDNIRTKLIGLTNKRVLGFTTKNDIEILLLTNINSYHDLCKLKCLLTPGTEEKRFVYLYYAPVRHLDFDSMYEPTCWHFKYKDGIVGLPSIHK